MTKSDRRDHVAQRRKSRGLLLTERDRRVLNFFNAIRFAETSHFAGALVPSDFPTEEKLRRRLRKLAQMGYLDRPARRISAERLSPFEVAGEERTRGRPEDIWALAQRGAKVLSLPGDWNKNNGRLRSSAFPHRLMISRVYSTLMRAASTGLITVEDWLGENEWRGRIAVEDESLPLIPDGVFIVSDNLSDAEAMIFLETDNSTEPLRRTTMVQSSFFKKCVAYWHYWIDEIRPRRESMIVLTVAKTAERAETLRQTAKTVDERGRGLNLFWFAHEAEWEIATPGKFFHEPIWTTANDEHRALFDRTGIDVQAHS
jgi:hypothetical protein